MIVFLRFYGTPALLHITIIMTHESLFFVVEGANLNRVLVSCSSIRPARFLTCISSIRSRVSRYTLENSLSL